MGASGGPGSSGQQRVPAGALLLHLRRVAKKVRGIRFSGVESFGVSVVGVSFWGVLFGF